MAKKEAKKFDELFHDTLKDIYFAEKKMLTVLPKMEKAAHRSELKRAFAKHRTQTEGQVERLEEVFSAIDKKPQGKTCDAIVGITDEGAEIMKEYKGSPALDAGLLAAAQAVEHYEISRYGTLKTWAQELGLSAAARLLEETLMEEKETDALFDPTPLSVSADRLHTCCHSRACARPRSWPRISFDALSLKNFLVHAAVR